MTDKKSGKGILNIVKGVFFDEEEEGNPKQSTEPVQAAEVVQSSQPVSQNRSGVATHQAMLLDEESTHDDLNQKFLDKYRAVVNQVATPKLQEFLAKVNKMKAAGKNEAAAYRDTYDFLVGEVFNSPEELLEETNKQQQALDNGSQQFSRDVEAKQHALDKEEQSLSSYDDNIRQLEEQVENIKTQINELNTAKLSVMDDIAAKRSKLAAKVNQAELTLKVVRSEVNDLAKNINSYLSVKSITPKA